MLYRLAGVALTVAVLVGASALLLAAADRGPLPDSLRTTPHELEWPVTPAKAMAVRDDALARASVRLAPPHAFTLPELPTFTGPDETLSCRFIAEEPSGTTSKFDCVLADGQVVKVKYGRNAEGPAEILATRLLRGLGYGADHVGVARRVRCYGCPRFPFLTMRLLSRIGQQDRLAPHGFEEGYTEFEWVAVERKLDAAPLEAEGVKGWGWFELKRSQAPRADLDAFRLLAVFMAHWDNKAENQRLVCLDPLPGSPDQPCAQPLAMMQDVGSTFGPTKLNLVRWREVPIWSDRRACTVSMRGFPFRGATFPDATISEEGRTQLVAQLSSIGDHDLERMFVDARGPEFLSGTNDAQDVAAWREAFHLRVEQLRNAGPCPSGRPSLARDGPGVD